MTKQGSDMRQALETLHSKRRYRNINHAKLARMLECVELNAPASWVRAHADLSFLPERKHNALHIPKKAWCVLVPAGAAAALFILFMTGLFDFMCGDTSGIARMVSGDVVVSIGGTERILRAGDAVACGDVVVTGGNSSADMHFGNLLNMRVLGGSRVAIRTVALGGSTRAFDVLVSRGGCVLDVSRIAAGESVSVHTQASVGVVRGTRFGVMVGPDGTTRYEVFKGTVRVRRSLPPDVPGDSEAAEIIDRHFRDKALDLMGGQACAIGTDPLPLGSISRETAKSVITSLALPVPVRAMPVMRDDMERLVKLSEDGGAGQDIGAGRKVRRDLPTEREAAQDRGRAYLMYIPVLECVVKIGDRYLTAERSGNVLWSVPLYGPVISAPAYEATSLYLPTAWGAIVKVDLFTGETQWKAVVPGGMSGSISLTLDGSGLYCATSRGTLSKYDRSGEKLWSVTAGEAISARPVISDQLVFVSTRKGSLFGFDASNGTKVITVSIRGSIVSIAARKSTVFIATDAGRLYCYDYGDDDMLWEYQVNDTPAGEISVTGHSVYLFGQKGRIYRINNEGNLVWDRDLGIHILKRPSEDAASFYIPARESLFVVDKITGDVTWSLVLPNITSSNVAVSKGHIYFETGKKRLTSLKK